MTDGPMSTPRRPAPRSSVPPITATSRAASSTLTARRLTGRQELRYGERVRVFRSSARVGDMVGGSADAEDVVPGSPVSCEGRAAELPEVVAGRPQRSSRAGRDVGLWRDGAVPTMLRPADPDVVPASRGVVGM